MPPQPDSLIVRTDHRDTDRSHIVALDGSGRELRSIDVSVLGGKRLQRKVAESTESGKREICAIGAR